MALRGQGMQKDSDAAEAFFKRAEQLGFALEDYLRANHIEWQPGAKPTIRD